MEFSLWNPFGFDLYSLARPLLFKLDPETVHETAIKLLGHGLGPRFTKPDNPLLRTSFFGLDFPNPIGLAAGFDTNALVMDEIAKIGFGVLEVGTVTPQPQKGNPKPRIFRIQEAKALLHRRGANNDGLDTVVARLKSWREKTGRTRIPVGINIGKNNDAPEDAIALSESLVKAAPYVDYLVINVPSLPTESPRDIKYRAYLTHFLRHIMDTRQQHAPSLPVLVKMSPDLTESQQKDLAAAALSSGIQGLIVGATTSARPSIVPREIADEAGGISGGPLFSLSMRVLANMYRFTKGKIPLIGCGGISNGEDAYAKIRAGASLVQIHSALIFEGPLVVRRIKSELTALLRRDGFASVAEAVGTMQKD